MKEEYITNGIYVLPFVASGILFCLFLVLAGGNFSRPVFFRNSRELLEHMALRGRNLSWYQKNRQWLQKNGAQYHFGEKVSPINFLAARIIIAGFGLFVVSTLSVPFAILISLFLFLLPVWLLTYLNHQDNRRLLPELKLLYHGLEIQIRAGVYVTNALAECYGCVQEPRMKQALLDLASDIVMHADIYQALKHLQEKFDNRHIDSLCIIILQAMESGQAVELLRDLAEQIKDMEITALAGKKEALDRSLTFYQLGILVAVMGIVMYACVTQMFAVAVNL